jgi:hypothetical protein
MATVSEYWIEDAGRMDAELHGVDDREPVDPVDVWLNERDGDRRRVSDGPTRDS